MRQPDDIDDMPMPESLGPCSAHGRMNCLECYDLDLDELPEVDDSFDAEAENEAHVREREYQESGPQTLADVGMCEADFR